MRRIPILQIGAGGVGQALIEQVLWFNEHRGGRYGFRFAYIGLADRQGAIVADERIPPLVLRDAIDAKRAGGSLADAEAGGPLRDWRNLLSPDPCVVIDVTAQDGAEDGLIAAIEQGHRVVLANKKPLCAGHESFTALTHGGRTRYEATVGAGLPVISTLQMLLDTGDRVERISGCFSGTLGYLLSELESGAAYSAAVREARARGWTEPDPRDDLSGMDVARKALILARTAGMQLELSDVAVEPLFGSDLADQLPEAFMSQLERMDESFRERVAQAAADERVLRYVADVHGGAARIGLTAVERDSAIGALRGPDNLVVFTTQRYSERPLSVRGPGAGVEVTASAVLSDLIGHAREWR
jgi:homoserine dehydrogenase